MAQGSSAAEALRLLTTGCYSLVSFDAALEDAQEACMEPQIAQRIAAARIRYRIHERSLCGIVHGSEEHHAWACERKQVQHEIRAALHGAMLTETEGEGSTAL